MASLTLLTHPLKLPAEELRRTCQGGQQGYSYPEYLRWVEGGLKAAGLLLGLRHFFIGSCRRLLLAKPGRCLCLLAPALFHDSVELFLPAGLVHVGIFTENACHSVCSFAAVYRRVRCLWQLARKYRQLRVECPLVGGPRFTARHIRGKVRIAVQQARRFQPQQHRHHPQITRAEGAIEPIGRAKARRELTQPDANAILHQRQALFGPRLVAL
jgi:hypothetical protein